MKRVWSGPPAGNDGFRAGVVLLPTSKPCPLESRHGRLESRMSTPPIAPRCRDCSAHFYVARPVRASLITLALAALCFAQPTTNPYQEGIRLLRNQNWRTAAAELERAVELQPRSVDAHIALG